MHAMPCRPSSRPSPTRAAARIIGLLLAVAAATGAFVLVTSVSASARAAVGGPSLKVTPGQPTNREPVRISGRFPGKGHGRLARLEKDTGFFGAQWTSIGTATTDAEGGFVFRLARISDDTRFRVVPVDGSGHASVAGPLTVRVRYVSVDRRWVRGDASANRAAFFACFDDSGDRCASDDNAAMSPGWLAFVLVASLVAGGAGAGYLGWIAGDRAADAIRDRRTGDRYRGAIAGGTIAALEVGWLFLFYDLAFGYALPRIGLETNAISGTFLYPLYLLVLVSGLLLMVGYPMFAAGLRRSGTLSIGRSRLVLYALVLAILLAWRWIYLRFPAVAAGPFEARTAWLNDALHTWTLQWPLTALWYVLRFFATPEGIAVFGALAVLSGVLPDRRRLGHGMPSRAVLGVVHGTAANAAALIAGAAMMTVIGFLAFAALALALVFLAAVAIYYTLVIIVVGAMISWVVRR